ncbi:hypothetical protein HMPREF3115_21440 [Burkholderia sp. HMSC10F09]|nr:hypothetical protein HMPREF3115_21440 [Burkholderia sp. HMSC10F09]
MTLKNSPVVRHTITGVFKLLINQRLTQRSRGNVLATGPQYISYVVDATIRSLIILTQLASDLFLLICDRRIHVGKWHFRSMQNRIVDHQPFTPLVYNRRGCIACDHLMEVHPRIRLQQVAEHLRHLGW